jgi:inner membrane protein
VDWLSIVDPLLTVPWLIVFFLVVFGATRKLVIATFVYSAIYISYCGLLHYKAEKSYRELALQKGWSQEKVRVLPALASSFWYRGVSASPDHIYVAGIFVHPVTHQVFYREGNVVERFNPHPNWEANAALLRQIRIWRWFTDDYMYMADPTQFEIGDGRYSTEVADFVPLWVLRVNPLDPKKTRRAMPSIQNAAVARSPLEAYSLLFDRADLEPLPQQK